MTRLRLSDIEDDPPVKLTVTLPGVLHRDLVLYAGLLAQESGQPPADPARLIAPMLGRFIAADQAFAKAKRAAAAQTARDTSRTSATSIANGPKPQEH